MTTPSLGHADALVLVDVQVDFYPGGALAVPDGEEVVPVLNRWVEAAVRGGAVVAASRDRHPPGHVSFAERGGPWPAHCVRDTPGAEFHPGLRLPADALIIDKATDPERDAYSAFSGTGLGPALRRRGVTAVWVGGLALDVCVRATVLDALKEGFRAHLIRDGSRPVSVEKGEEAVREMAGAGAAVESGGGRE